MSDKVTPIRPPEEGQPTGGTPHHGVVHLLRETLAKAEAGQIFSIAIAYATEDGSNWGRVWDGKSSHIIFATSRLIHEVQLELDASEAAP